MVGEVEGELAPLRISSVVEQPHPRKRHHDAILIGRLNDIVVPDAAAGLGDVLHAGLSRSLHVVAEGEEGVGAAGDAGEGRDPGALLLRRQGFRLHGEGLLPDAREGMSDKCDMCELPYKICKKLADYEDTELTPEQIAGLKERDTAKMCKQSIFDHDSITCVCGSDMDKDVEFKFCPWCGQRLKKWED